MHRRLQPQASAGTGKVTDESLGEGRWVAAKSLPYLGSVEGHASIPGPVIRSVQGWISYWVGPEASITDVAAKQVPVPKPQLACAALYHCWISRRRRRHCGTAGTRSPPQLHSSYGLDFSCRLHPKVR